MLTIDPATIKLLPADKSVKRGEWMKNLFLTAFPPEERMPYFLLRLWAKEFVDWWIIYLKDTKVGFFYAIKHQDHVYLIFFAIDAAFRHQGIGTIALKQLLTLYADLNVFIAIEPIEETAPNLDERVKRKNFYLNCGFKELHQRMQELSFTYELLGTGAPIAPAMYRAIMEKWLMWPLKKILPLKILA